MTFKLRSGKLTPSFLPRAAVTALLAGLVLPVTGASAAHAETGKVRLTQDAEVRYQNLDFEKREDRQTLLSMIEAEARKFCSANKIGSVPEGCEARLVVNAMASNQEAERRALALALIERTGVAQAMR
jgi:UrcA family protein